MKSLIKPGLLIAVFLGCAAAVDAQVSIGVRIGSPPPPRAYHVPPQPGPDYGWVEGYHYPVNGHYKWHEGYWTRPPYRGAYWVAPYHTGGKYYAGHWDGDRGAVHHDHRWDSHKDRDANHGPQRHSH